MRMVTGALLLLGAEQAYAHANLIQFPNHIESRAVLLPASVTMLALGVLVLIWGLLTERKTGCCPGKKPGPPSPEGA